LLADSKILAGGTFTTIGGGSHANIAQLDPTFGTLDSNFPAAANGNRKRDCRSGGRQDTHWRGLHEHHWMARQHTRNGVARLNSNGTLDSSFANPNVTGGVVNAVAVQGSSVIIGGTFTTVNSNGRNHIARLDSSGNPDSFNPNVTGSAVNAVAVQSSDGHILIGGNFTMVGGTGRNNIAEPILTASSMPSIPMRTML